VRRKGPTRTFFSSPSLPPERGKKGPSHRLADALLHHVQRAQGFKGHHRSTARRRRARLRPHACTGEGCHDGTFSSCVANSGHRRFCATGCCVREKCGEERGRAEEKWLGFRGANGRWGVLFGRNSRTAV
jgi:hypothetical protein